MARMSIKESYRLTWPIWRCCLRNLPARSHCGVGRGGESFILMKLRRYSLEMCNDFQGLLVLKCLCRGRKKRVRVVCHSRTSALVPPFAERTFLVGKTLSAGVHLVTSTAGLRNWQR